MSIETVDIQEGVVPNIAMRGSNGFVLHSFALNRTGFVTVVGTREDVQRRVTVTVTVTVTKVFILRFLLKDRKCITESFTYIQRSSG